MLWQTIIGPDILADYGLYAPTTRLTPTDTFSFDAATVASQITNPNLNPALAGEPITSMWILAILTGRIVRSSSAIAQCS